MASTTPDNSVIGFHAGKTGLVTRQLVLEILMNSMDFRRQRSGIAAREKFSKSMQKGGTLVRK